MKNCTINAKPNDISNRNIECMRVIVDNMFDYITHHGNRDIDVFLSLIDRVVMMFDDERDIDAFAVVFRDDDQRSEFTISKVDKTKLDEIFDDQDRLDETKIHDAMDEQAEFNYVNDLVFEEDEDDDDDEGPAPCSTTYVDYKNKIPDDVKTESNKETKSRMRVDDLNPEERAKRMNAWKNVMPKARKIHLHRDDDDIKENPDTSTKNEKKVDETARKRANLNASPEDMAAIHNAAHILLSTVGSVTNELHTICGCIGDLLFDIDIATKPHEED